MSFPTNYLGMSVEAAHTIAEIDREAEILDPGHIRRCTDEAGVLSPADVREYVTRSDHGGIPAGTSCFVSRPDGGLMLRLEFADGRVVWTAGHAAGIEWRVDHGLRIGAALDTMAAAEEQARAESRSTEPQP